MHVAPAGGMSSLRTLRALLLAADAGSPGVACGGNVTGGSPSTDGTAAAGALGATTSTAGRATTDGTTSVIGTTAAVGGGTTTSVRGGDEAALGGGRPFVVGGEARTATGATRADWLAAAIDTAAQHESAISVAIPGAWMKDALLEHASIASFAKLTLELMALGAPPELISGCQRASLDEIEHARLCFALASRFAKTSLGPSALRMDTLGGERSLVDVAVATVREGCVAETLAALVAAERDRVARHTEAKKALRRIARDEARHAALAWQTVRWALEVGGAPVRESVTRAFAEELARVRSRSASPAPPVAPAAWHAHGLLLPTEELELMQRGASEIVEACAAALGLALAPEPPSGPRLA